MQVHALAFPLPVEVTQDLECNSEYKALPMPCFFVAPEPRGPKQPARRFPALADKSASQDHAVRGAGTFASAWVGREDLHRGAD